MKLTKKQKLCVRTLAKLILWFGRLMHMPEMALDKFAACLFSMMEADIYNIFYKFKQTYTKNILANSQKFTTMINSWIWWMVASNEGTGWICNLHYFLWWDLLFTKCFINVERNSLAKSSK